MTPDENFISKENLHKTGFASGADVKGSGTKVGQHVQNDRIITCKINYC